MRETTRFIEALFICSRFYMTEEIEDEILWAVDRLYVNGVITPYDLLILHLMSMGLRLSDIARHMNMSLGNIIHRRDFIFSSIQFLIGGVAYDTYLAKRIVLRQGEYNDDMVKAILTKFKQGVLEHECERSKMYS